MPARPELRIVGAVEVTRADGTVVTLQSPKAQAVAARLVLDRDASGTSREELASVVWPEGPPDTWGSALRSILTRVRRFLDDGGLGEAEISSRNGRYVLRLPDEVDVDLERLERVAAAPEDDTSAAPGAAPTDHTPSDHDVDEALRVTTREFLPDNDSPWARAVRERIDTLRSSCLEASSRHAERTHDPSRAVVLAREAVEHSPLRESAHRALMRAHAASGNRADALAAYHRCKAVLAEEIGVPPSRETTDLYLRILGEAETAPSSAGRRTASRSPYVGRGPGLDALGAAWDEARDGATAVVLVTGEPGIGRTRLLQEFVRKVAGSDDLVVWCHGRGSDPSRPALQAALAFHVDALAVDPGDPTDPAEAEDRAQRIGPATRQVALGAAGGGPGASPADAVVSGGGAVLAARLREALLEVVRTSGPLLLLLDDLGDLDEVSLVALRDALVEGGPSLPVALVATADLTRLPPAHRAVLRELEQVVPARRRTLRRLGVVAAHDLAWQLLEGRSDATHEAVREAGLEAALSGSGGNPYLLQLLTRDQPDRTVLDRALADDVDRRLVGLGPATLTFAAAAAVAGAVVDVDLVRAVVGQDQATAHDVVRELLEHDLLTATGDAGPDPAYAFAHGVVRDVLYRRLPAAERRRLHGDLADQVWAQRAPGASTYSGWLAHQLAEAGQSDAAAVDGYLLAAAAAEREGAATRSAELYAAALDLLPGDDVAHRARVATSLGLALWRCGDRQAVERLTGAVYDAVVSDQLGLGLTAATALVDAWVEPDSATEGGSDDEDEGEARAMVELMVEQLDALTTADLESLGSILGRFLAHAVRLGVDVSSAHLRRGVVRLTGLLEATTDPRRAPERLRMADDLHVLADLLADAEALFVAADQGLAAAALIGDGHDLAERIDRWEVAAAEHPDHEVVVRRHRERELAVAAPADPGDGPPLTGDDVDLWSRQVLVNAWVRRAALGSAVGSASVVAQRDSPFSPSAGASLHGLADRALELALDGRETPARHTVALATRVDTRPVDDAALHSLGVLALVAAQVGTPDQAQLLLDRLEPVGHLVSGCGYRTFVGPVALHQGRLASRLQRYDAAERHLLSALTTAAQLVGHELWVVVVERELAAVLEARGRVDDGPAAADLRREADQLAAVLRSRP